MSYPTSVNNQITDAATQGNTIVLGSAPAVGMGGLINMVAGAIGNSAQNLTAATSQSGITGQAIATMGAAMLYALDPAAMAKPTGEQQD